MRRLEKQTCAVMYSACWLCAVAAGAACSGSMTDDGLESTPTSPPAMASPPPAMPADAPSIAPTPQVSGMTPLAVAPEMPAAMEQPTPESIWLAGIGNGPEQTAKVCSRGAQDPIALALCAAQTPSIHSLIDLHTALSIPDTDANNQNNGRLQRQGGGTRLIGMTANSASLVSRFTSALNPRVVVGVIPDQGEGASRQFAVGFVRGEPFAELAGYDDVMGRINFYLLVFQPTCAGAHCTPAELLTQSIEHEWQGWTLYQAEDLTNTPLDCLSCHQPEGPQAPRRFLMRQLRNPWMHWMPQEPNNINCGNNQDQVSYVTPRLFDTFRAARTGEARYAGIELATLSQVRAGRQLETFINTFENTMSGGGNNIRNQNQQAVVGETNVFPSRNVLSDSLCDSTQTTWSSYRPGLRDSGRPVPFYMPDVLDPAQRDEAAVDYRAFLDRRAESDEFTLVSHLMSDEAARGVGFQPEADAPAEAILSELCVRCHNDNTDPSLSRARFNAQSLDKLKPEEARKVLERISLPADSPLLMPPRRFGELPPPAAETMRSFFDARAAAPLP